MMREDGNSYTDYIEAITQAERMRDMSTKKGMPCAFYVQRRGSENYLVTPVQYSSYKTVFHFDAQQSA